MKFRHEHKFLLENDTYLSLKHSLSKIMELDENLIQP
jgi:hypothetical protein